MTSFGTEDRNAPKRIPAGNEVYEYIIFRGSDIKDLHVKPIPPKEVVVDDPAIVSVSGYVYQRVVTTTKASVTRIKIKSRINFALNQAIKTL